jgi:hypothetical protein
MASPKDQLAKLKGAELEKRIGWMLDDPVQRNRFQIFFNNEYYSALVPVRDRMLLLPAAIDSLIHRGALSEMDREIVRITRQVADDWFVESS